MICRVPSQDQNQRETLKEKQGKRQGILLKSEDAQPRAAGLGARGGAGTQVDSGVLTPGTQA